MRTLSVSEWLRQLDRDAASGALWRRPELFAPAYLVAGAVVGATLGYVLPFAVLLLMPTEPVGLSATDPPETVGPPDYSAVPILGAFAGCLLGVFVGALLALRRWQRTRALSRVPSGRRRRRC